MADPLIKELYAYLKSRLHLLGSVVPLDTQAVDTQWARINELEQLIQHLTAWIDQSVH